MPANPNPEDTPEEQLRKFKAALEEEWEVRTADATEETQAELYLRDNALRAAQAMVTIMTTTQSERTALTAARYILDRVVFNDEDSEDITDVMKKLLAKGAESDGK